MARKIEIMVGGDRPRIRLLVAGDAITVVTSKCFAEFIRQMKWANEGSRNPETKQPWAMPALAESETLCILHGGADGYDTPQRFPDIPYKLILDFLSGEDVIPEAGYDTQVIDRSKPKMYTPTELEGIVLKGVRAALTAAGHVAEPVPVSEPVEIEEGGEVEGNGNERKRPDLADYQTADLSVREYKFAKLLLGGLITDPIAIAEKAGYTRTAYVARRLTTKHPVISLMFDDMIATRGSLVE